MLSDPRYSRYRPDRPLQAIEDIFATVRCLTATRSVENMIVRTF